MTSQHQNPNPFVHEADQVVRSAVHISQRTPPAQPTGPGIHNTAQTTLTTTVEDTEMTTAPTSSSSIPSLSRNTRYQQEDDEDQEDDANQYHRYRKPYVHPAFREPLGRHIQQARTLINRINALDNILQRLEREDIPMPKSFRITTKLNFPKEEAVKAGETFNRLKTQLETDFRKIALEARTKEQERKKRELQEIPELFYKEISDIRDEIKIENTEHFKFDQRKPDLEDAITTFTVRFNDIHYAARQKAKHRAKEAQKEQERRTKKMEESQGMVHPTIIRQTIKQVVQQSVQAEVSRYLTRMEPTPYKKPIPRAQRTTLKNPKYSKPKSPTNPRHSNPRHSNPNPSAYPKALGRGGPRSLTPTRPQDKTKREQRRPREQDKHTENTYRTRNTYRRSTYNRNTYNNRR